MNCETVDRLVCMHGLEVPLWALNCDVYFVCMHAHINARATGGRQCACVNNLRNQLIVCHADLSP